MFEELILILSNLFLPKDICYNSSRLKDYGRKYVSKTKRCLQTLRGN